jgi:hypothetical protein
MWLSTTYSVCRHTVNGCFRTARAKEHVLQGMCTFIHASSCFQVAQCIYNLDARFATALQEEVTKLVQMERGNLTAFHPQTDGQTERMHGQDPGRMMLRMMLRHFITPINTLGDWV